MKPALVIALILGGGIWLPPQERELRMPKQALLTLQIPGYPDFLAADGTGAWVTNENRVEKLDAGSSKPVVTAEVPEPCGAMTVAFGSLWVPSCKEKALYRIDAHSGAKISKIETGLAEPEGELSVAAGNGSVWLLTDDHGTVSRVDPATNKVSASIQVKPHSYAATYGFGRVWITNTGSKQGNDVGTVQAVDPVSARVVATINVGPMPRFLCAGEGAVWALNQGDGTVSRIDPKSMRVTATIPTGIAGPGGDIDSGLGRVWVRGKSILLKTIDPATNTIAETFGPPSGSGAVRVAGDLVWVSAHDIQTIWVLRPSRNQR